jgi:hypothetical protein
LTRLDRFKVCSIRGRSATRADCGDGRDAIANPFRLGRSRFTCFTSLANFTKMVLHQSGPAALRAAAPEHGSHGIELAVRVVLVVDAVPRPGPMSGGPHRKVFHNAFRLAESLP